MTLPPVPDAFHWTEETWGAALRCRPLEVVAPHLFTTRQLELTDSADVGRMAAAVGAEQAVLLTQVHGRAVVAIREHERPPTGRPEADVLVSNARGVAVAVRAADCVPLLMADPRTGAVAAVHAGWRGTAARAAVAAVETMAGEFGADVRDLIVAIGPSIGACCYDVGSELVDAFAAEGHERYLIDRWFLAPPPPRGEFRPALSEIEGPKLRLDVAGANRDQLILAGVREENIHLSGLCTAMHLDLLTSYRVEREKARRIAGAIARANPR
jgi:YfiH family protein